MNKTLFYSSVILNVIMLAGLILTGSRLLRNKPPVSDEVPRWTEDLPSPGGITIAMLGNSLTAYADWNKLLGRADIRNFGVADFTMKQLSWLLADWVIKSQPSLCFVNGGQLDIMLDIPLERIADDYTMILDSLQHNGITPVVQSTLLRWENPEANRKAEKLNQLLKAVCFKKNISYINLNAVLCNSQGLRPHLTTDGMHLNHKGYELWAILLRDYLLLNDPQNAN